MYIPTVVIICIVCGAIGGTLGYCLTKKNGSIINTVDNKYQPYLNL